MKTTTSIALLLIVASNAALTHAFAVDGDALDRDFLAVIQNKCVMCHDDRPGDSGSDVEKLLDLTWLADASQGYIGDDAADSYLAEIINEGHMPKESWKQIKWGGPLSDSEKTTVLEWIKRGGPSDEYRSAAAQQTASQKRRLISERQIVVDIATDLQKLKGAELKNARYLTLANLHNRGSVTTDQLELHRQGIVKMLNSLSRSSDILGMPDSEAPNKIVAVDKAATVFRFDLRHIGWTSDDWESVVRHYPYALAFHDGLGQAVGSLTSSGVPYMRADWFVFATSQAPLYHKLVGIDEMLTDLETKLGIDRLANIRNARVARAGFGNSRVSVNNRLIERHAFRGGYYHISYDFFKNSGRANFFDFPLGPVGAFDSQLAFEHDGGEVIYTLPNGFQAYVLVTASGKRISIAPASVVHDDSMSQVGSVILNGISCISCHYDGMKPENPARLAELDEVRERSLSNVRRFTAKDRDLISELYPQRKKFQQLIEADQASWRTAMRQAGLTKTGPAEPVRALFDTFVRNLNLETAAAEFGMAPTAFLNKLGMESETRQLSLRLEKEGMQRQLFVEEFRHIANLTGLGTPKTFEPLFVPYFGHNPDQPTENATPENSSVAQNSSTEDSELLSANNNPADLKVTVQNTDDRKLFIDGESIPVSLRATDDCFVTALAIAPNGEVTSLIPNKRHHQTDGAFWWSNFKLPRNQTQKIDIDTVGFEFFAQAPHGATKIRVIVTKDKPLKLRLHQSAAQQLKSEGIPSLGFSKGAGVRFGQPATNQPPANTTIPNDVLEQAMNKLFAPNAWATTEWTFLTREKR